MLTQIVRPMVRTQIRLLAGSQATRPVLVKTIAQWLGFLGVEAQVTQLASASNQIQLSLTVGKPEACDTKDWEKILVSLGDDAGTVKVNSSQVMHKFSTKQQTQLQRLLAYVIQVGDPNSTVDWDRLKPELEDIGFEETLIDGIQSALKVPQSLELLMESIDDDVAAVALPKAVSLALLDRKVNPSEDHALSSLLAAMKQSTSVSKAAG
ncbi:MAG: hypothetical protein AAF215_12360 [Cyanobacteria bacterium P01_A01_bin.123]